MYPRGTNINVCGLEPKIVRETNIDQGLKWYVEQRSKTRKTRYILKVSKNFQ